MSPSNVKKEILTDYPGLSDAAVLEKYRQLKVIKMFNDRAKASTKPAP